MNQYVPIEFCTQPIFLFYKHGLTHIIYIKFSITYLDLLIWKKEALITAKSLQKKKLGTSSK